MVRLPDKVWHGVFADRSFVTIGQGDEIRDIDRRWCRVEERELVSQAEAFEMIQFSARVSSRLLLVRFQSPDTMD